MFWDLRLFRRGNLDIFDITIHEYHVGLCCDLDLGLTLQTTHLNMTAWGLEKSIVRTQAVSTISLARLLCAAQLRDNSGDWMVISLAKGFFYYFLSVFLFLMMVESWAK